MYSYYVCVCVCVRACVRACVRVCVLNENYFGLNTSWAPVERGFERELKLNWDSTVECELICMLIFQLLDSWNSTEVQLNLGWTSLVEIFIFFVWAGPHTVVAN